MAAGGWALLAATALSAGSQVYSAQKQEEAYEEQAAQYRENARLREEQGERQAAMERRRMRIDISNARAQQAAGGGDTMDPSALQQVGEIAGEHRYNELAYLYEAQTEGQGLRRAARNKRRDATTARNVGYTQALSTAISGASQAYQSFQGPDTTQTLDTTPTPSTYAYQRPRGVMA